MRIWIHATRLHDICLLINQKRTNYLCGFSTDTGDRVHLIQGVSDFPIHKRQSFYKCQWIPNPVTFSLINEKCSFWTCYCLYKDFGEITLNTRNLRCNFTFFTSRGIHLIIKIIHLSMTKGIGEYCDSLRSKTDIPPQIVQNKLCTKCCRGKKSH